MSPAGRLKARPRPAARSAEGFYGWHMVAWSCIALVMTAPGQTAAVSVFIDPMIAELGVSRSAISTGYLIGTLAGAVALPFIGKALDRFGVRATMAVIGLVFGGVLCALATVSGMVGLTAGFAGIRMAGQGALGLTATTVVALWFARRRGTAAGIVSAFGSIGISMTPVLVERLIGVANWRVAWLVEGLVVWAVVIPIALFAIRNRPADLGQRMDGRPPADGDQARPDWGVNRAVAMRTGFFWVTGLAVAMCGLLSTAVAFHQISLLGERGLSPVEAAANFVPQTGATLVATLVAGALVDRVSSRLLVAGSMACLTAGLLFGTVVTPGWSAVVFGLLIGFPGGAVRVIETATFPRYYGISHIGEIRGVVIAVTVGATAFGPLLFAAVHGATASYTPALLMAAPLPLVVGVAALIIRPPSLADHR